MGDLELFPGDDTRRSNLVRLHAKTAILIIKHVRLLRKYPGKQPDNGPTEESAIRSRITPIEKRVVLFRVAVQVTVDPDVSLVLHFYLLHQVFHGADFGVEAFFWVDPLPIQIDTSQRIPVISANDTIRIHYRN